MKNSIQKILLLLGIFIFSTIHFIPSVSACMAYSGDFWFKAKIQFDNKTIPEGVQIYKNTHESSADIEEKQFSDNFYIIENTSSTPLYLFPSSHFSEEELKKRSPLFTYKLQNGKVFTTHQKVTRENYTSSTIKWYESSADYYEVRRRNPGDLDSPIGLLLSIYTMENIMNIDLRNERGDGRPAVPIRLANQDFKINAITGTTPIEIKGRVEYELNPDYNARSVYDDPCTASFRNQRGYSLWYVVIGTGLGLLVVALLVLYVVYRRKTKPKSN